MRGKATKTAQEQMLAIENEAERSNIEEQFENKSVNRKETRIIGRRPGIHSLNGGATECTVV